MGTNPDLHWSTTLLVVGIRQLIQSTSQLLASSYGPPAFDTSHILAAGKETANTGGLRWDAIHYVAVAKDGYQYEQQLAWMPLWPLLMRLSGELLALTRGVLGRVFSTPDWCGGVSISDLVLGGALINVMVSAAAAASLYKLTRTLTGSHRFAQITCLFYALPPHPAASVAPYTEPLFAFLTFTGFLYSVKAKHLRAALLLALATGVRSTGIFNIAILGWQILFGTSLPGRSHLHPRRLLPRALLAVPLCLLVIAPFFAFQYYAYISFCSESATRRPWCDARVSMPYSFVQAEYWNNGLFNYWTLEQLPNFLLAAPVLLVSIIPSVSYLRSLVASGSGSAIPPKHHALLPFHLHHLLLTALLVFGSHTQIALRTAITDPVVWWNVASVAFRWEPPSVQSQPVASVPEQTEKKDAQTETSLAGGQMTTVGRIWVGWVVVWGAISLVLWSAHLPPA